MSGTTYHHGNLRKELLKAAEKELRRTGLEKFSLRSVARAAGVSHAAPAHHFKDVKGLATALATVGFERILRAQRKRQADVGYNPVERRAAAGLAYIEFSERHPELFDLMFVSRLPDHCDPDLQRVANETFLNLVKLVNSIKGEEDTSSMAHQADVYASWAIVHGLSSLMNAGKFPEFDGDKKRQRAMLRSILVDNLSK